MSLQLSPVGAPASADGVGRTCREVAQSAAELVLAATGVDLSGLAIFTPDGQTQMMAAAGHRFESWPQLVIAPGDGVAGQVLKLGGTVSLADYASESGSSSRLIDVFSREEAAYGMLAVPVRQAGLITGVMYGGIRRPEHIGDRGRAILVNVASLVSAALVRPPAEKVPVSPPPGEPGHRTSAPTPGGAGLLSQREVQILRLLGDGLSTRDVAAAEHLAVNTVRSYVQSALWKLGAHSRLQAVALAREASLL